MRPQARSTDERRVVVVATLPRARTLAAALRRAGYLPALADAGGAADAMVCAVPDAGALDPLASRAGGVPLVAIDVPPELLEEALARGADEVVLRGATSRELLARLAAAIARREADGSRRPTREVEEGAFARSTSDGPLAAHALSRGELEALLEITEAATGHLELEELLRVVVAKIAEVVPSDRCSAILLDDDEHATVMASHDVPGLRRLRIAVDRYPEVRAAVESRAPVIIDDVHTDPIMADVRPLVSTLPVSSLVVAPLVARGDAYGALFLRLARSRAFGEREKAFVRAAASAVANSVRNARLHTSVRQKRDELEAAYEQRYDELRRLNEQLQEANRIKDELLAIASHDLRSPLNALLGHARLLLGGELPPAAQRSVQVIERQGLRVLQLVQQILESGRGRTLRGAEEPVDLARMARGLAADALPERGIRLVATGDEAVVVQGDASALRQVLENLVSNAVTHSPDGAEVEIEVQLAAGGEHARVEVRDRGPGIPEAELPLLFERYRKRGDSTGLGLGLAICREVVEAHGGAIWAAARAGGGACFVFSVPLARTHGRKRLLAICEDPALAADLVALLGDEAPAVARTLRDGLQQAARLLPEAVLVQGSIEGAGAALRAEPGLGEVPLIFLGPGGGEGARTVPLPLEAAALRAALG